MKPYRPSAIQRQCLIEATIAPLHRFRVGYARTKAGPFYPRKTIAALLKDGSLRPLTIGMRAVTALAPERT